MVSPICWKQKLLKSKAICRIPLKTGDMSPWGQIYYVTGADAGAPELWNWITGNPGEIIGFNVKVVSI